MQNDRVRYGNTYVEGHVTWGQPRLPSQGGVATAFTNFGFPPFMFTPFDVERPFDV